MKKIIILTLAIFTLVSCGQNSDNVVKENGEKNTQVVEKNKEDINGEEREKTVPEVMESLKKLEAIEVSSDELYMLDENINSIYDSSIIKKALESNDIGLCSKLDNNYKKSCEKKVIINSGDVSKCDTFTGTGEINNCKNEIFSSKAHSDLDETVCDNIIDESEEKFEINNCKNRILEEKAIKNLDTKICNKISTEANKQMCSEMVKMEKEMKAEQDRMEKEMKTNG